MLVYSVTDITLVKESPEWYHYKLKQVDLGCGLPQGCPSSSGPGTGELVGVNKVKEKGKYSRLKEGHV